MEKEVLEYIKQNKLIDSGDVVGVAVSGGADSMCLLHFLHSHSEELDISVVAITVDHMLRGENSLGDALFVRDFCRERGIACYKYSVDCRGIADEGGLSIEESARIGRYGIFNKLLDDNKVDKVALAHHLSDQAETILMHILRGAGLNGAVGMEPKRGQYIRPLLAVTKDDIIRYCSMEDVEYVDDETNRDDSFNRNFLRLNVMPLLKKRWENVEQNLASFGEMAKEDNAFILSQVSHNGVIYGEGVVRIPALYMNYAPSISSRIIFECLDRIGMRKDIERKHIDLIRCLSVQNNGKKITLPNRLVAQKEYDYITLFKKEEKKEATAPFKIGKVDFLDSKILVEEAESVQIQADKLYLDADKVPEGAIWRVRQTGDMFTKFGGGSKSLKDYFIDVKVPVRLRSQLPVLASGNEVYCIAGLEISDKVKVTDSTSHIVSVSLD